MRILKFLTLLLIVTSIFSCEKGINGSPTTAEEYSILEDEIKSNFGDDVYYTEIVVSCYDFIKVIVTDNPASLEMAEWIYVDGSWTQRAEITYEIPEDANATDFMFQIGSEINLKKLGELFEKSIAFLLMDKGIENPVLERSSFQFPKNGDINNAQYSIILKPENGVESYTFLYKLNGDLIREN